MIVSANINGIAVEIRGTENECRSILPDIYPQLGITTVIPRKICDPFSRHIGNCGAQECPVIAPNETLASYQWRLGIER